MSISATLFERAQQVIPGGVNSPVRAFKSVGGTPRYIQSGQGAYITDEDGKRYLDFVDSWGPLILGHAHPAVIEAVTQAAQNGLSFGAPIKTGVELAEKITQLYPNIDSVRMVNSGTEATMSAIRLARGFTGRDKILKFAGCYHGHVDALLVKAGSGLLTLGIPGSPGIPNDFTQHTLVAEFNHLKQVEALFKQHADDIAAIIVEPIAGNCGCIPPLPGFLQGLRELCDQYGSLLIFDEVITGFRVNLGGAQAHYQVKPDLTTLGKIIGGGMPVGAFGGRQDIMQMMAPTGPVYQAGTLSGNPIAMAAGLATLNELEQTNPYTKLEELAHLFVTSMQELADHYHIPFTYNQVGSMFAFFFTEEKTVTYTEQVNETNLKHFNQFFHNMLEAGINFAPSAYETSFISTAHTKTDIENALNKIESAFSALMTES